ncbi:MAG: hypothetical protein H6R16_1224 [Proteobacteria bacterium]|nr:hypothetical protein [Pseudomonadota bacterium]
MPVLTVRWSIFRLEPIAGSHLVDALFERSVKNSTSRKVVTQPNEAPRIAAQDHSGKR